MKVHEVELIYVDESSQVKDVIYNPTLRGSKLDGMRPRIVLVHRHLLEYIGLERYLQVMDALHIMEHPRKIVYFITDGLNEMSDPLTQAEVVDIQMNHNGYSYRLR
jgi:hypothetical protein